MAHSIDGILWRTSTPAGDALSLPDSFLLRACRLPQDCHFLPDPHLLVVGQGLPSTIVPGFYCLTDGLAAVLRDTSNDLPVAFIETDYFGGTGTQAASLWSDGELAWYKPHSDAEAVNHALGALGVAAVDLLDCFETVQLGRHRCNSDWAIRATCQRVAALLWSVAGELKLLDHRLATAEYRMFSTVRDLKHDTQTLRRDAKRRSQRSRVRHAIAEAEQLLAGLG